MSYIMPLTNPERLYIYADSRKTVWIHGGLPIPGSTENFSVPRRLFHQVALAWDRGYGPDKVRRRNLIVEEVHVFTMTGKLVSKNHDCLKAILDGVKKKRAVPEHPIMTEFLIRLSYGRNRLYMWRVTWSYIVMNVKGRQG